MKNIFHKSGRSTYYGALKINIKARKVIGTLLGKEGWSLLLKHVELYILDTLFTANVKGVFFINKQNEIGEEQMNGKTAIRKTIRKVVRKSASLMMATVLIATLFLTAQAAVFAAASGQMSVNVRIEGINTCLYYKTVKIPYTDTLTLKDALTYVDNQESGLTISGMDGGYITSINGESAGKFGGWDGWLFMVNGIEPAVGIDAYTLKDGDKVVLYYGDPYGVGMQFPEADISKISDGIIKFTSADTTYDADYNPTVTVNPVKGATVTWYDGNTSYTYTTDNNGEIKIQNDQLTAGSHKIQIDKKDASGLPLVLRFANDFTVEIKSGNSGGQNSQTPVNTNNTTSPANTGTPKLSANPDIPSTGCDCNYSLYFLITITAISGIVLIKIFNKRYANKK